MSNEDCCSTDEGSTSSWQGCIRRTQLNNIKTEHIHSDMDVLLESPVMEIRAMKQTLEAQDRQIPENTQEIAALKDAYEPTPTSNKSFVYEPRKSVEAVINKIMELLPVDLDEACSKMRAFYPRYTTTSLHADKILKSPEIICVLDLYVDLKELHIWRVGGYFNMKPCEQTIADWVCWVEAGQPPEDENNPFMSSWYIELEDEMGW